MNDVKQELALAALENYLKTKSSHALERFWQLYPKPIPRWHLTMMNDVSRNEFYRREIQSLCRDKIIMDLGAGSGLLTQYALESGAKLIYAVEQDPVLQKCFEFTFRDEITSGKIKLLCKNSKEIKADDFIWGKPEVVIHEIFGTALFDEKVIETFQDLFSRNILDIAAEYIPQKFSLHGCLHKQEFESAISDPKYKEKFWYLENISYFGIPVQRKSSEDDQGEDVSEEFEIFTIDLKSLPDSLKSDMTIYADKDGNQLRVWFNLIGRESELTTNIKSNKETHWGNSKFLMRFKAGEVSVTSTYQNERFLSYAKK